MTSDADRRSAQRDAASGPGRGDPRWRLSRDPLSPAMGALSPGEPGRWIVILVILGVLVRSTRYFLRFPLWSDESFLAIQFTERGYGELTGALDYRQVAPFLFLWVQLTGVKLFGFNEYSLRLLPFASGLLSLFLFVHVSRALLKGASLVLAVGIFAVAYPLVRYSAELKPYGSDVLVAMILLTLTVSWWKDGGRTRWLWALAAFVPLACGFSYPSVFLAGGIGLVTFFGLWESGSRRGWIAWAAYHVALVGGVVVLFVVSASAQSTSELEWMRRFWNEAFPPLASPLKIPGWLLRQFTGELLPYPVGGKRGASSLSFVCCLVALASLYRSRRFGVLLLSTSPVVLNLVAAALKRYPFGPTRCELYLGPIFCLLTGLGAATLIGWCVRRPAGRRVAVLATLAVLVSIGVGSMARDFRRPAKTLSDLRARDFARWFWFTSEFDAETVCLVDDSPLSYRRRSRKMQSSLVSFVCYRRIYSPAWGRGEAPSLERVAVKGRLRCVDYRVRGKYDERGRAAWIKRMESRYRLAEKQTFAFPRFNKAEEDLQGIDYVDVFTFVPRQGNGAVEPTEKN
ncbi:MAG: glycosyltransferase family 39 protein [Planctomycetota bacterium]|nr:glycosyltransferase family 39 protein [Planctomycetota bacterium]